MRFRYFKTILESQDTDSPIADISWSPNNIKLAVATSERVVLLFDRDGIRRDKFSTKPADPTAGKKSYVITSIVFSENSELLGVAQSDNMVFVYRVGADWSGKKVICNKFPLTGAPLHLLPAENGFFTGTSDGKIRLLDCKSNKSSSLWSVGTCCVSLARGQDATLASGHVDGTLYLNGRLLLRYALPPTALVLLTPYLLVGSCDGRVAVYEAQRGALLRNIEPALPPDKKDFLAVSPSPSGQTVAFGIFDGCLIGDIKESGTVEFTPVNIGNLYAARALTWSGDGTKLAIASQTGAVIVLEAVLKCWVWRESVEVQHVSARQLLLRRLAGDAPAVTLSSKHADIYTVKFIGQDWYAICRTASTLILCDIAHGLTSEIPWMGTGERIYAAVGGACLIHRAGELSVVEYGLDKVLHTRHVSLALADTWRGLLRNCTVGAGDGMRLESQSTLRNSASPPQVRTERVNPHVLSVRINERTQDGERKHLAYLLDRQTLAVVDLITGVQLGQWWHEARIDWLELNEGGQLLLLRDTRRRLALLRLDTTEKEIIASGVGFVQWIENSDAIIAQTPTHLLIWYSGWEPNCVEMCECGGGTVVEVADRKVILDGGQVAYISLDEHRLAFNNALRNGDLSGCAAYLDSVNTGADISPLWRQLAEKALEKQDIELAAKCYRGVGDEAKTFYLDTTLKLANAEGQGDVSSGLGSALVQANLAIFAGDLATAEDWYIRKAGQAELAITMYKQFNRWTDAISVAERVDRTAVPGLKQQYMDYLHSTGRKGEAGAVLAASGDIRGAIKIWVSAGRARRAAAAMLQHPALLRDDELLHAVHDQLVREEWWEMAGEISERRGDNKTAVEYYAKGNYYARAVQLAREACPGEVTRLEGEWGAWLVESNRAAAAVPHLIEAGRTRDALAAAIEAHHYKKALQIVQVIDDKESIRQECERLGEHFITIQDWETAERVLISCGMAERCVRAYNLAGKIIDGLRVATAQISEDETRDIYLPLAKQLRDEGQLRKAEQIYIGLGDPDEAISMYKNASQYEAMLRLVAAHRPPLVEATRRHVAQALQAAGDLRAAENYYIQADDWKSAIAMYRSNSQWENAERVARTHAPVAIQQQTALQWAATLSASAAARLLAARGLAAIGARWALQAQRWDIAMELSSLGGGITKREVARHEASALAEEQPEEAEAAFLRAGAPDDAVSMWLAKGYHQRALTLAEQHATHMIEEVLVEGARASAERGNLQQFETLMIRANRPREVVQHYKQLEMWEEAGRVSREYLPDSTEAVPPAVPPLLQRAADHADRGEWWEAVRLLIGASAAAASGGAGRLAERAALRAARLARDKLSGDSRRAAADMLVERFDAIGQGEVGEQLRAALLEGEVEEAGPSEAPVEVDAPEVREELEVENSALEKLARAGQWARCLAHAGARAPHYALRYAAHLFKTQDRLEGFNIESEEIPDALSQVLDTLRQYLILDGAQISSSDVPLAKAVSNEILVRVSMAPKAFSALKDAAEILVVAEADDKLIQALTLLMGLHVPQIAGRAGRALPRYTDIIVADVAFYAAGVAIRDEGSIGSREAFVFLNHCLDLAEAADEESHHLLDYTDFECTDWPREPLLLESACVRGETLDALRDWVLALSMDRDVEQTLELDSRGWYGARAAEGEAVCVLTGYPLGSRLVTFTNGRCANREWWSRATQAARNSNAVASSLLQHITKWCGPADFSHI